MSNTEPMGYKLWSKTVFKISAMIFTFDLEIRFKITANHLAKSYVYVKYVPGRAKRRECVI